MRLLYILLSLLFVVVVIVFAVQNMAKTTIFFLGYSATLPLSLVIIGSYVLGMLTGGSVLGFIRASFRSAASQDR